MNLTDYLNQKEPIKLNHGEVELTADEVVIGATEPAMAGFESYTRIWIKQLHANYDFNPTYIKKKRSDILYTIDEGGNPKSMSVFSFKIN